MNKELRNLAEEARKSYRSKIIDRDEAIKQINPFVEAYNQKSKEIAKKYNQRAKTISVASFLR